MFEVVLQYETISFRGSGFNRSYLKTVANQLFFIENLVGKIQVLLIIITNDDSVLFKCPSK